MAYAYAQKSNFLCAPLASVESLSDPVYEELRTISNPNILEDIHSLSSERSIETCRICHEPNNINDLISPCKCSGSMAIVHRNCLEMWINSANMARCEVCQTEFELNKGARSCIEWFRRPSEPGDRVDILFDLICFSVLLPFTIASVWFCFVGALHFGKENKKGLHIALILLSVCLLVVFFIWFTITCRYHMTIYYAWKRENTFIYLKGKSIRKPVQISHLTDEKSSTADEHSLETV